MNAIQRTIVALAVACVPLLALAQGYKCKQADGSVSYQDHACAAGTASSSALPTDIGGATALRNSLPPSGSLDASCEQSARHALSTCFSGMDVALKRCQATRMTSACNAQMATPGVRPDPACASQAMTCLGESLQPAKACMDRELPAACKQKIDAYRRNRQR
jgi:hypothetical protein